MHWWNYVLAAKQERKKYIFIIVKNEMKRMWNFKRSHDVRRKTMSSTVFILLFLRCFPSSVCAQRFIVGLDFVNTNRSGMNVWVYWIHFSTNICVRLERIEPNINAHRLNTWNWCLFIRPFKNVFISSGVRIVSYRLNIANKLQIMCICILKVFETRA